MAVPGAVLQGDCQKSCIEIEYISHVGGRREAEGRCEGKLLGVWYAWRCEEVRVHGTILYLMSYSGKVDLGFSLLSL